MSEIDIDDICDLVAEGRDITASQAKYYLNHFIAIERAEAIAAEREACAKVAEADTSFDMLQDFGMQSHSAQLRINIAEAIRARGK